jgi:hypothetical protein
MLRKLLICGLVAGVCGGLVAAGFAALAGERAVDAAIAYEEAGEPVPAPGIVAEPAPVSRDVQKSVGLLTATLVYGLALGGIFALAFAFAYGRVSARTGPRATAYWLAAAAFTVVSLVPAIKYPASPPASTVEETIGERTGLYLSMVAISVLAAIAAARLRPTLERRWDAHNANLGAGLAFLVVVVVAGLALPSVHEIPADFPATTLWRFREASFGLQAALWLTIGLVFAPLAQRAMTGQRLLGRLEARAPAAAVAE